jgi:DNA helicase-2/ATP-dependent DNA helicase PcrA
LNTQRIDKVLKATRQAGEPIYCYQAPDEMAEARFVLKTMKELRKNNPELGWGSFAILYRTNSQSRPFEDVLRTEAPYVIIGGLKFYDRKEIKDALAYLRAIANPADTVSLLRVINTPKRGIGQATIDNLMAFAQELNVPLWEIISDNTSVATVGGRSAKKVQLFTDVIKKWQAAMQDPEVTAETIVQGVLEDSGYVNDLKQQGTEEADGRLENLSELVKAVVQFQNDQESTSLGDFLASAALASDLDNLQEGEEAISLMTLHSAKGLEFPIVFLVGLEQGLFPHFRSLDDPIALEEERRLCYVGITRAQEQLFISHAEERSQYWGARSATVPSQFLRELPEDLIEGNMKSEKKVAATEKPQQKTTVSKASVKSSVRTAPSSNRSNQNSVLPATAWEVGDKVYNPNLGIGIIHKIFGDGSEKIMLAVKFGKSQKIIDPKVTKLTPIE